jgi:hypothetical protein
MPAVLGTISVEKPASWTMFCHSSHAHSMTAICRITACRITNEQLVMEGIASTHTEKKPIRFHVTCFYVWDAERRAPAARAIHTPPSEESKPPDP